MRAVLDRLYVAAGALAAVSLLCMLGVILAQILARWLGLTFPGSTDYAGYLMATSSFLAFAYALRHNAHIRVSLLLSRLTGRARQLAELWCFGVGSFLAWYFAYYAVKAVRVSYLIHDISQGQDATPLWIPQLSMAAGTVILAIALTDGLVQVARGRLPASGEGPLVE